MNKFAAAGAVAAEEGRPGSRFSSFLGSDKRLNLGSLGKVLRLIGYGLDDPDFGASFVETGGSG